MAFTDTVNTILTIIGVAKFVVMGLKATPDVPPAIASIEDIVLKDASEIEKVVTDAEAGQLAVLGTVSVQGEEFYIAFFSKSG